MLSYSQQYIYYAEQKVRGSYNISLLIDSSFIQTNPDYQFDKLELIHLIQVIISRHSSLHTGFCIRNGTSLVETFKTLDYTPRSTDQTAASKETLYQASIEHIFDLSKPPLVHVYWNTLDTSYFAIVFHHIIFDGWSANLFRQELTSLFHSIPLIESPDHYLEFCTREFVRRESTQYQQSLWWWRQLIHPAFIMDLPYLSTTSSLYSNLLVTSTQDPKRLEELRNISNTYKLNTLTMFHLLFGLLFGFYTKQQKLVWGGAYFNRDSSEIEHTIGMCSSTVLYCYLFDTAQTIETWIQSSKIQYKDLFYKHRVFFRDLFDLHPQIMILTGVNDFFTKSFEWSSRRLSKYDLLIGIYYVNKSTLSINWIYNETKFSKERIQEMSDLLLFIIDHFNPSIVIQDLYYTFTLKGINNPKSELLNTDLNNLSLLK